MQKAKQRAEREIEKARQEAQRIISRTRAQADAVAEELEKARKAKDMSVQARTQLKKNIDKMEAHADPVKARNTPDEEYKLPRPLKVGDTVLIYDIDKNATVLAPPNKDGVVLVQAGIIKTRVDIKNLRLLKSNNPQRTDFQAQEMCRAEWMSVPKRRLMSVVKPPSTQSILLTRQLTMPYFRV